MANRPDTKDLAVAPDGKYVYVVGPVATQVTVFATDTDSLPKELPDGHSPYLINQGQWVAGEWL